MRRRGVALNIGVFCLSIIIIFLFFAGSIQVRSQFRNRPLSVHHEAETAVTTCYVRNWFEIGILKMRLMMHRRPESIDYHILDNLDKSYISYPPGSSLPIFVIAKVTGIRDFIKICIVYNLFNHLVISVFLFLIMWLFVTRFGSLDLWSFILSLAPPFIYLFTLPPLYFHQQVYFTDPAIIMPFVIFVYLEFRYFIQGRFNKAEAACSWCVVFFMTLTNWLSIFALLVGAVLRLYALEGQDRGRRSRDILFHYAVPASVALGIYFYQVFFIGDPQMLLGCFFNRLRVSNDGVVTNFWRQFFVKYLLFGYGKAFIIPGFIGIPALVGWYAACKLTRPSSGKDALDAAAYVAVLTALPCILIALVFQQLHIVHDFTIVKWAVSFSLVPFALIPLMIIWRFRGSRSYHAVSLIVTIICMVGLLEVRTYASTNLKSYFMEGKTYLKNMGEVVQKNSTADDICFSFDIEITTNQPVIKLGYSGRLVKNVASFAEIDDWIALWRVRQEAGIKVFICARDWPRLEEEARRRSVRIIPFRNYYVCVLREAKARNKAAR